MELQGRNLSIEMHGEDVNLLQSELRQLNYRISTQEIARRFFGNDTRSAVLAFQHTENLPPTGIVDEATARLITNRVEAQAGSTFVISGQTKDSVTGEPLFGLTVEASMQAEQQVLLTGSSLTNANGEYAIPFDRSALASLPSGQTLQVSLRVRQGGNQLPQLQHNPVIASLRPENHRIDVQVVRQPVPRALAPRSLNKQQLLVLEQHAGMTLKALRTENPELFQHIHPMVATERKEVVLDSFAKSSQALRDALQRTDFTLDDRLDGNLKQIIFESLQNQQVTVEVVQEAVERTLELERSNALVDMSAVDVPIQEHLLFQRELQHAAIFQLADVVDLSEAKVEKLLARCEHIAAINDAVLKTLVAEGTLEEQEAQTLGLTASLYHLTDNRLDLTQALKNAEFASLQGRKLAHITDLVKLPVSEWIAVLERSGIQPPEAMRGCLETKPF